MSADRAPARDWYNLAAETAAVKGWSMADLSNRSGVARSTIYGWRDNSGKPQAKSVNAVADALGIPRERALRLAGIIAAPAPQAESPPERELPRPDELERLRQHVRDVLGDKAERTLDAIDRAMGERPRRNGAGASGLSERRPAAGLRS